MAETVGNWGLWSRSRSKAQKLHTEGPIEIPEQTSRNDREKTEFADLFAGIYRHLVYTCPTLGCYDAGRRSSVRMRRAAGFSTVYRSEIGTDGFSLRPVRRCRLSLELRVLRACVATEREREREGTIELKGREIGSWFATFATCYASSSLEIWIKLGFQLFFWGSKTGENKRRGRWRHRTLSWCTPCHHSIKNRCSTSTMLLSNRRRLLLCLLTLLCTRSLRLRLSPMTTKA
jgi:hypothetical protein